MMGAEQHQVALSWSLVSHQWEPIPAEAQGWRVACRSPCSLPPGKSYGASVTSADNISREPKCTAPPRSPSQTHAPGSSPHAEPASGTFRNGRVSTFPWGGDRRVALDRLAAGGCVRTIPGREQRERRARRPLSAWPFPVHRLLHNDPSRSHSDGMERGFFCLHKLKQNICEKNNPSPSPLLVKSLHCRCNSKSQCKLFLRKSIWGPYCIPARCFSLGESPSWSLARGKRRCQLRANTSPVRSGTRGSSA